MVKCPAGKIINPVSGRCVDRDGKKGKDLNKEDLVSDNKAHIENKERSDLEQKHGLGGKSGQAYDAALESKIEENQSKINSLPKSSFVDKAKSALAASGLGSKKMKEARKEKNQKIKDIARYLKN
jgi:peptide subunit release factor 1 (eRF1)